MKKIYCTFFYLRFYCLQIFYKVFLRIKGLMTRGPHSRLRFRRSRPNPNPNPAIRDWDRDWNFRCRDSESGLSFENWRFGILDEESLKFAPTFGENLEQFFSEKQSYFCHVQILACLQRAEFLTKPIAQFGPEQISKY